MVAMVTNTVERGQQKCEQYWPDEGTKEYGPFKVTLTDQHVFADYTIRQLFVTVSFIISNYTFFIGNLFFLHEQQYMLATFELQNSITAHNWYMYMYSLIPRPLHQMRFLHIVYLERGFFYTKLRLGTFAA